MRGNTWSVIVGIGGLVWLSAASASACEQCAKSPGMDAARVQRKVERLDRKLGLSDEQQAQIEQIRAEYAGRLQPLKDQLTALKQEERDRIKTVLTPKQQAKFDAAKKKGNKKWGRRHKQDHD